MLASSVEAFAVYAALLCAIASFIVERPRYNEKSDSRVVFYVSMRVSASETYCDTPGKTGNARS